LLKCQTRSPAEGVEFSGQVFSPATAATLTTQAEQLTQQMQKMAATGP